MTEKLCKLTKTPLNLFNDTQFRTFWFLSVSLWFLTMTAVIWLQRIIVNKSCFEKQKAFALVPDLTSCVFRNHRWILLNAVWRVRVGVSGPSGGLYTTLSRDPCGFMDSFNYNMAGCCPGNGLLLACCFPRGEEVSLSPAALQWSYIRSHLLTGLWAYYH